VRWDFSRAGEVGREKVTFHVVNAVEGLAGGGGEGLGIGEPNEEGGGKTWATSGREGFDFLEGDFGGFQGLLDEGANALGVITACDFRNYATVFAMNLDLGGDEGAEELRSLGSSADDCDGCFVAGRFDGE